VWIPESEREILDAVEAGDPAESATFDAKASLPSPGRSKDLAVDVAAMTVDGGTLLYGVAKDNNGRPRVPSLIELAGAAERVSQIVQSCISEPPAIEVREISSEVSRTGRTSTGALRGSRLFPWRRTPATRPEGWSRPSRVPSQARDTTLSPAETRLSCEPRAYRSASAV